MTQLVGLQLIGNAFARKWISGRRTRPAVTRLAQRLKPHLPSNVWQISPSLTPWNFN